MKSDEHPAALCSNKSIDKWLHSGQEDGQGGRTRGRKEDGHDGGLRSDSSQGCLPEDGATLAEP